MTEITREQRNDMFKIVQSVMTNENIKTIDKAQQIVAKRLGIAWATVNNYYYLKSKRGA